MTTSAGLAEESRSALRFLRKQQHVEYEFNAMNIEVQSIERTVAASTLDCFNYPKPLMVGWGIACLQQIAGQPSVLYFTITTFKGAGLGTPSAALSSVGVAAMMVLATIFAVTRAWASPLPGDQRHDRHVRHMAVAFLFQECSDASVAPGACTDFVLP